jgi:hypothetical protein
MMRDLGNLPWPLHRAKFEREPFGKAASTPAKPCHSRKFGPADLFKSRRRLEVENRPAQNFSIRLELTDSYGQFAEIHLSQIQIWLNEYLPRCGRLSVRQAGRSSARQKRVG